MHSYKICLIMMNMLKINLFNNINLIIIFNNK